MYDVTTQQKLYEKTGAAVGIAITDTFLIQQFAGDEKEGVVVEESPPRFSENETGNSIRISDARTGELIYSKEYKGTCSICCDAPSDVMAVLSKER